MRLPNGIVAKKLGRHARESWRAWNAEGRVEAWTAEQREQALELVALLEALEAAAGDARQQASLSRLIRQHREALGRPKAGSGKGLGGGGAGGRGWGRCPGPWKQRPVPRDNRRASPGSSVSTERRSDCSGRRSERRPERSPLASRGARPPASPAG